MTGAMAADAICRAGQAGVVVQSGGRYLSRHYDPNLRTLSLDPYTYEGRSITSIGKGIYEAGHVLQQRHCYRWFRMRPGSVPFNNFGTRNFRWFCLYGVFLKVTSLRSGLLDEQLAEDKISNGIASVLGFLGDGALALAALMFLAILVSQLAALRVGIDASKRAAAALGKIDLRATQAEREGLAKVIHSAPWAYVGVTLTALVAMPNRQAMHIPVHADARDGLFLFY